MNKFTIKKKNISESTTEIVLCFEGSKDDDDMSKRYCNIDMACS